MTTAVGVTAEHAGRGDEHAGVVVCGAADVVRHALPVIAAGHAVVVDRGQVVGHGQFGVQSKPVGGGRVTRLGDERPELRQHDRKAGLLAHLHRIAAQRAPSPIDGVVAERLADLVPVLGCPAMVPGERRLDLATVGRLDTRHHTGGQVPVEVGEKVVSFGLVVTGGRKDRVPPHPAVVRRSVVLPVRHGVSCSRSWVSSDQARAWAWSGARPCDALGEALVQSIPRGVARCMNVLLVYHYVKCAV